MPRKKNTVTILLVAVILTAILVRGVTAWWLGDQAVPLSGAYDQVSYDTLAQRVLEGKGFSFPSNWYPFTKADEPTAHWSFLYTLYLSGVYAVFGHHPLIARLIQVALSGAILLLVFRLGRRLFDEWVGLAAAAAAAVYAYLIFFNAALMTQTFYIIMVLASIDIAFGLVQKPTYWRWALLGVVLGLGILFRQTLLLYAILLFGWLWWAMRSQVTLPAQAAERPAPQPQTAAARGGWAPLFGMLIAVMVIAAFILPWTLRNFVTYNDFLLLNSNGGYWFYASNHPGQGTMFNQSFAPPIPDNLQGLTEPAIDRALFQQGLRFILADPVRFLLLSVSRLKDYFWILPSEQSSSISNIARLLSFAVYLPFMIYGLWLSRRHWQLCLPLYLYIAFDGLLCLTTWAAPRYRLPSDVLLMVFVGLAVTSLVSQVKTHMPMLTNKRSLREDSAG